MQNGEYERIANPRKITGYADVSSACRREAYVPAHGLQEFFSRSEKKLKTEN